MICGEGRALEQALAAHVPDLLVVADVAQRGLGLGVALVHERPEPARQALPDRLGVHAVERGGRGL